MDAKKRNNRCIMCGEMKSGLPVKDDYVIQTVRWFKKTVTKNEKGYALVVCKECYPSYAKQRQKFEQRQILYVVLGVIFAVVLFVASTNKLIALVYGFTVLVFIYLLSLLTYIPALEIPRSATKKLKNSSNTT